MIEAQEEEMRQRLGLVTQEELATAIHVELNTLAVWRHRGIGPTFTKLGKTVFYVMEDVLEWIKANRTNLLKENPPATMGLAPPGTSNLPQTSDTA